MALHNSLFHLKLNHSDRLVHLGCQSRIYCIINVFIQDLWHKPYTGIILINLCGKHGQRTQVNAVTIFQHIKTVVADRDTQYITDTGQIACSCSHPRNVVVAPLDIHIMEIHQFLHNDVCSWSSVKDITDNMKIINGQVLDQTAQCHNKLVRNAGIDDGMDDLIVVKLLILVTVIYMEQFINNIGKLLRHLFSHLGAGIFRRYFPTDLNKSVNGDLLPVFGITSHFHHPRQMTFRIIDQISQLKLLLFRDQMSECFLDLFPDDTGRRPQQMDKCFILSMKVTEKVLGSFWQITDRH